MRISRIFFILSILLFACGQVKKEYLLVAQIRNNKSYPHVKQMCLDVVRSGFQAGDGYGEVWIRDFNTFIELSAKIFPDDTLKEKLLVFFRLQGEDGNIVDGYIPKQKATSGYDYIFSPLEPRFAGHKNTVETDQETSLVQAVFKYIKATDDSLIIYAFIGDRSIGDRLEASMDYLLKNRYDEEHGLLYGATTADWGDVQPEHEWGVYLTKDTHLAIDIYDNAMFIIAIDNLIEMIPALSLKWKPIRNSIAANARKHLWDTKRQKFIPHIYLNGSPFDSTFNENDIYYHGGTAIAIEANLLSKEEIATSLRSMVANVKASGAGSIGLTLYPPYPAGSFANQGMYPYGYQNGGDWDWFGGRMIQQLVRTGFINEAVEQLQPMLDRAEKNHGFFEWYTKDNTPEGSGTFRGSAGVLYKAIDMLESSVDENAQHKIKE